MLKVLDEKILVKKVSPVSKLILDNIDDRYEIISVGDKLPSSLVGKIAYINEGLIKIEYEQSEYFVTNIHNVIAYEA